MPIIAQIMLLSEMKLSNISLHI